MISVSGRTVRAAEAKRSPTGRARTLWERLQAVATLALGLVLVASGVGAAEDGTVWPSGSEFNSQHWQDWDYEVINGMAIYDGDIILGPAPDGGAARHLPAKRTGGAWPERRGIIHANPLGISLWPNGVIPYDIDLEFASEPIFLEALEEAIDFWHSHTVVRWIPRTTEELGVLRISVTDLSASAIGTTGVASVGYHGGGSLWLASSYLDQLSDSRDSRHTDAIKKSILDTLHHEMGHVVGLLHEHQRKDSSQYTFSGALANTARYSLPIIGVGPYDFASGMSYRVLSRPYGITHGNLLSVGDIDGINRLYGSPPRATTISTHPPGGLVTVDGENYRTPITFSWPLGSQHMVSAPPAGIAGDNLYVENYTSGIQVFARWSDGGPIEHAITASPDTTWLTAYYATRPPPCSIDRYRNGLNYSSHYQTNPPFSDLPMARPGLFANESAVATETVVELQGDIGLLEFSPVPLQTAFGNNGRTKSIVYPVGTSVQFSAKRCGNGNLAGSVPIWSGYNIPKQQVGNTEQPVVMNRGNQIVRMECVFEREKLLLEDQPKEFNIPEASASVRDFVIPYWSEMDGFTVDLISPQTADLAIASDLPTRFQRMSWGFRAVVEYQAHIDPLNPGLTSGTSFHINVSRRTKDSIGKTLRGSLRVHSVRWRHGPVRIADRGQLLFATGVDTIPLAQTIWVRRISSEISAVRLESDGPSILTSPVGLTLADSEFHAIQFTPSTVGLEPGVHQGTVRVVPVASPAASSSIGRAVTSEEVPFSLIVDEPDRLQGIAVESLPSLPENRETLFNGALIRFQPIFFCPPIDDVSYQVTLDIGGQERRSNLHGEIGYGLYRVQASDRDTDGARITAIEAVRQGEAGAVALDLSQLGAGSLMTPKIDGSRLSQPRVQITSRPLDGVAFRAGEGIHVAIEFPVPVIHLNWKREPTLTLDIGHRRVQATLRTSAWFHRAESHVLSFRYQVQAEDRDADGISIAADALSNSNGETITGSYAGVDDVDLPLDLGENALLNIGSTRVDGRTHIAAPSVAAVFLGGTGDVTRARLGSSDDVPSGPREYLFAHVQFDREVEVTGNPELIFAIGGRRVQATLSGRRGFKILVFEYRIRREDSGTMSLPLDDAGSLMLRGGTVRDENGIEARFTLGTGTFIGRLHDSEGNFNLSPFPRVDSSAGISPPSLHEVEIISTPFDGGDTYREGESIGIVLRYNQPIKVTGIPVLVLQIGNRRIPLVGGVGGDSLSLGFSYQVQAEDQDSNGISIGFDALSVFGGIMVDADTETELVPLALNRHAVTDAPGHKVDGDATFRFPLRVSDVFAYDFGNGNGASTRSPADFSEEIRVRECGKIRVGVAPYDSRSGRFVGWGSGPATLTGASPELSLLIGNRRVTLQPHPLYRYKGGRVPDGKTFLPDFQYCVEPGDFDLDGIEFPADGLTLNGGTFRDGDGVDVDLDLGHLEPLPLRVDGRVRSTPKVTKVAVDEYTYEYARRRNISRRARSFQPRDGTAYGAGEKLRVHLEFDPPVETVTGNPRLALRIGDRQVEAVYVARYYFEYTVQLEDRDADGFEIPITGGKLPITGGAFLGEDGSEADLAWGASVASRWPVDGSRVEVPSISSYSEPYIDLLVSGTPGEKALELAFGFYVSVVGATYSHVEVTGGSPELTVEIGNRRLQVPLAWRENPWLLFFRAVIPAGELEGELDEFNRLVVRFPEDPLALNGGTIRGEHRPTGAILAYSSPAAYSGKEWRFEWSDHNGRGIPKRTGRFSRAPSSRDVYRLGAPLEYCLDFSVPVEVTGSPQLALEIGDRQVQAAFSGLRSTRHPGFTWLGIGSNSVCFRYYVQADDRDEAGVEIPLQPISLNGGTIRGLYGDDAFLLIESWLRNSWRGGKVPRPTVDGSLAIAPTLKGAGIVYRPDDFNDYVPGEEIFLQVPFDAEVEVTGSPRLALEFGNRQVQADFVDVWSGVARTWYQWWQQGRLREPKNYSSPDVGNALYFRYVVQPGDLAEDGIRLPENALSLNGGTIGNGAFDADIAIAPRSYDRLKIGGVPKIRRVLPGGNRTFLAGESLQVIVSFDRSVVATGSPRLTLEIGDRRVEATYKYVHPRYPLRRTGRQMYFQYVVQAGDLDEDGIAVPENPLSLNGGTIRSRHGIDANLETPGVGPFTRTKVDGSRTGEP